jgi:glycosyltransferase involved in cell wall biosynthesis
MQICHALWVLPRLGILDFNPIQYHTPLYQRLARRGNVDLDVLFISDRGLQPVNGSEFGVSVAWDIDLLSGYAHDFLGTVDQPVRTVGGARALARWIPRHDAIVIHGYADRWMLLALAICRITRTPYLMRCDSHPDGLSAGLRRRLRDLAVRAVVSGSAAGLSAGLLNEEFYRKYGARRIVFAPYSVDDERFAAPPRHSRTEVLAHLGLSADRPVVLFCGKLYDWKRPLDLVAAVDLLPAEVTAVFVGDGALADRVRDRIGPGSGAVTGFVNQSELPDYYHAADVLVLPSEVEKWGLVVNEAMAAGTLPVVSDRVGAARDLVSGLGEVYSCGDVPGLAAALTRALDRTGDPSTARLVREHAARYSLDRTAAGFEEAALAVSVG